VATSGFLVQLAELCTSQPQAPALKATDYLPDEPSFDGVRLANDQSALELFGSHKGATIAAFERAGHLVLARGRAHRLAPLVEVGNEARL
jgi:hypothetical protein